MRNIVLHISLVLIAISSTAQNNINSKTINQLSSEKWGLSRYIWSHVNYKTDKNSKPVLDFDAIDNWEGVSKDRDELSISNDGKYVAYLISNGLDKSGRPQMDSLVIQSTEGNWRKALKVSKLGFFSADSRQFVYMDQNGLNFCQLGTGERNSITDAKSYSLPSNNKKDWMAYDKNDKEVVLLNLISGKEKKIANVDSYEFDHLSNWFICNVAGPEKKLWIRSLLMDKEFSFSNVSDYIFSDSGHDIVIRTIEGLELIGGLEDKTFRISTPNNGAGEIVSFNVDKLGKQVVFLTEKVLSNGHNSVSIWYYRKGMDKAVDVVDSSLVNTGAVLSKASLPSFSSDGHFIQFCIETPQQQRKAIAGDVKVTIWSYQDSIIQSKQEKNLANNRQKDFNAVMNIESGKIMLIAKEREVVASEILGNNVIVRENQVSYPLATNRFWEDHRGDSVWLITLQDGKRTFLSTTKQQDSHKFFCFSPDGNYVIYFDEERGCNYFSYNLKTGYSSNISNGIPRWYLGQQYPVNREWKQPTGFAAGSRIAGWSGKDEWVLVYDDYDIWQLDPLGQKEPICFTNNYGRRNKIIFELAKYSRNYGYNGVLPQEQLLLIAFDTKNKYNGYYKKAIGDKGNPEELRMGAFVLQQVEGTNLEDGMEPVKAANTNLWVVRKQTDKEASNYFVTSDFKTYKELSYFQPQKRFNWYTKEFHTYNGLDGTKCEGLLYKPENFDPQKKYPVIIIFYNQFADNLYAFPGPGYNTCAVEFGFQPGWLESHGYLVFTPSIHVSPLKYGPAALNIIEGAVQYLKRFSFVDSTAIAATAHSWSGKLGTYVFTHNKSLAAMAISEGFAFSNPISIALSIDDAQGTERESGLGELEVGFEYGNLWENRASWLDQTAVLNVDKATSPLLLFCGKQSIPSRIDQTTQLYTGLRRLDKKVWWLEYEEGAHLVQANEAKDYTIRFTQYFDHYLKHAPAPGWMTQGLPYAMKGIESRFELDAAGTCGLRNNRCYICDAWNLQYLRTPSMFDKPISEWKIDKDIEQELNRKISAERKKLAKEQEVEDRKIVGILKHGYPEDNKNKKVTTATMNH